MSVYAEYLHAETDEEREEALAAMKWEARMDKAAEERMEREREEE